MKKTIFCCLALLISLGMITQIYPQEKNIAANQALNQLKQFSKQLCKHLGFKSKKELNEASLGTPFHIVMVGLKDLAQFQSGNNPNSIIMDIKKFIYPVYVGSTLKSSITIVKRGRHWKPAAIGGWELSYLESARKILSKPLSRERAQIGLGALPTLFVVRIPAMYMSFLGYRRNNNLFLVPIHPHPDYSYQLYRPILAENVFNELKHYVNKYRKVYGQKKHK